MFFFDTTIVQEKNASVKGSYFKDGSTDIDYTFLRNNKKC